VDEARKVIERLERIEALQSDRAPAADLLAEVRHLVREGEAWIAAEHERRRETGERRASAEAASSTAGAEEALSGCRTTLARGEEVVRREVDRTAI
jgi:hypothetical protein